MGGNDLYNLLHAKSIERDKEIIKNGKKRLVKMNKKACFKYLLSKINWYEENVRREVKKGNDVLLSPFSIFLELYNKLLDDLESNPTFISDFKEIITNDKKFWVEYREIELNRLLDMSEDQYIIYIKQTIQYLQQAKEKFEKEKYWNFPIKREELEKNLKEYKVTLSKFQEDTDYINKIRKNLTNQLISLRK